MNRLDVYGIGNALVDQEFEVEDDFFQQAGIEKGFMTLIDSSQQEQLLSLLRRRYPIKKRAGGGSAANTLYALSRFGGQAFYSCKVANDETGDFYVTELGNSNIRTNLSNEREQGETGRCTVMVTPDAERTMLTHLGISQHVSEAELRLDEAKTAQYVYIEGYLVTSDSARQAAKQLKQAAEQAGVKTALTFSDPAMVEYFRDGVNELIGSGVDLLFCNEKEARIWSNETELDAVCKKIANVARQFAITRGAEGALLFDGEKFIEIAPHNVQPVDTNGAGDMFAGAFLYGLTQGMSFKQAGDLASLASSAVVAQFGPRLTPQQHGELLLRFNSSSH